MIIFFQKRIYLKNKQSTVFSCLKRIILFLMIFFISSKCFSLDIFAQKNRDSHQILILIPERLLDDGRNTDSLNVNAILSVEIFRNKTKPVYQTSKKINFIIKNRMSENANIPFFIESNLKSGYYRFHIQVYNKNNDSKKIFKEIVSVPRKSNLISNLYLFAFDNNVLIAPTIPINKKCDYDSLKIIGSLKKETKKVGIKIFSDKKAGENIFYEVNNKIIDINFKAPKLNKLIFLVLNKGIFYPQELDFFTFIKKFQLMYNYKMQLKQLGLILTANDLRYLKSVPEMQLQTEINKFWEKNNLNLGYGKNKYQKIFYNRILYSDKKYTIRGYLPGWWTDRGKIFIKYGTPDEIIHDNYPLGNKSSIIWKYYNIDKNFVFIDLRGYGNYELEDKWNVE